MIILSQSKHDQNINRVYTKMSEGCSGRNVINTKISSVNVENLHFMSNVENDKVLELNSGYDHVYASNSGIVVPNNISNTNCQNADNEVKFLREWLLLHLDLIQQQNDEILNKEKTILKLKQENEMLKERLSCIQKGINFQSQIKGDESDSENSIADKKFKISEDSETVAEKDVKSNINQLSNEINNCVNTEENIALNNAVNLKKCDFSEEQIPQNDSNNSSNVYSSNCTNDSPLNSGNVRVKSEVQEISSKIGIDSSSIDNSFLNSSVGNNNLFAETYSAKTCADDTLKQIRMSIRRKRLCSNSSMLSNNDSLEEKNLSRKIRKRRKSSLKNEKLLICSDQYLTQAGELSFSSTEPEVCNELTRSTNLEVPRWRVRVYTSCYSMEGTENLDDEVFNRRHLKHENDERRRKRWDVQRIREQRIVEKLKQRQERVASGSKSEDQSEPVQSLWPMPEDIKYLEVCDQLPVSALGAPLPRILPSEFNLPWLNNPHFPIRRNSSRKSTARRKSTKR